MAFRKKAAAILEWQPDILIVPECEHLEKLQFPATIQQPTDSIWFGTNTNKGIGIFSYSQYRFKRMKRFNSKLKYIIPIEVTGGAQPFTLFAIWANNPSDPEGTYVEQIWKALSYYNKMIDGPVILMGDFNSNSIWDRPQRIGNHSAVVKKLANKNIHSTYHHYFKQEQGKESQPTLYMYRHKSKPYHLDYCFASHGLINQLVSVKIGEHEYWSPFSDHVPIMVHFNLTK
jgi:exonuclease III